MYTTRAGDPKEGYIYSGNTLRIFEYTKKDVELVHIRKYSATLPHTYFNICASAYWGICCFKNGKLFYDTKRKFPVLYYRREYDPNFESATDEIGYSISKEKVASWIRNYPMF